MGLHHRLARMEPTGGVGAAYRDLEAQRSLEFLSRLQRDHVRRNPAYLHVAREDCADEETWHEIRVTVAMAEGDFKEAARLRSLPAPEREAREAWINAAPNNALKIAQMGRPLEGLRFVSEALARARARTGIKGLLEV